MASARTHARMDARTCEVVYTSFHFPVTSSLRSGDDVGLMRSSALAKESTSFASSSLKPKPRLVVLILASSASFRSSLNSSEPIPKRAPTSSRRDARAIAARPPARGARRAIDDAPAACVRDARMCPPRIIDDDVILCSARPQGRMLQVLGSPQTRRSLSSFHFLHIANRDRQPQTVPWRQREEGCVVAIPPRARAACDRGRSCSYDARDSFPCFSLAAVPQPRRRGARSPAHHQSRRRHHSR